MVCGGGGATGEARGAAGEARRREARGAAEEAVDANPILGALVPSRASARRTDPRAARPTHPLHHSSKFVLIFFLLFFPFFFFQSIVSS